MANRLRSILRRKLAKYGVGKRRTSRHFLEVEKPDITLTDELEEALNLLENSSTNIFLTGRAGTGKSTLLKYFRAITNKNIVVLAPTGVAAVNVQGQTIHSFFKFYIDITLDKVHEKFGKRTLIYRKLDMVVIDEISMVRADLLDCVEKFLRLNGPKPGQPFGGVQIAFIGDPYQLPPIVKQDEERIFDSHYKSPFFFHAKSFLNAQFKQIELNHVFRQSDKNFIEILDAIRVCSVKDEHINFLNKKCYSENTNSTNEDFCVSLVPTNVMADEINLLNLADLSGHEKKYQGSINGEFPEKELPTSRELILKDGAQVMLLNNDKKGRWINGDLAKILTFNESTIRVVFEDNTFEDIVLYKWDKVRFRYDEEEDKIVSEIIGSFTQFPLRLAWALTIHKGQGKTFDKVIIDLGIGTFASGQAYVALSRCRSLGGLLLKSPLQRKHIFVDNRIVEFMQK